MGVPAGNNSERRSVLFHLLPHPNALHQHKAANPLASPSPAPCSPTKEVGLGWIQVGSLMQLGVKVAGQLPPHPPVFERRGPAPILRWPQTWPKDVNEVPAHTGGAWLRFSQGAGLSQCCGYIDRAPPEPEYHRTDSRDEEHQELPGEPPRQVETQQVAPDACVRDSCYSVCTFYYWLQCLICNSS